MAGKPHREIKVAGVTPSGKTVDANPPIAVKVRYSWTIGDQVFYSDAGWVLAWTTHQHVLVYWRDDDQIHLIWLRASDVRRRTIT